MDSAGGTDEYAYEEGGMVSHLELKNFKSYKGEQKIGPFKRFTAIIGPNGAGKSNLMDAISFVLGVGTTQLRGKQLRDLIFRQDGDDVDPARDAFVKLIFAKTGEEDVVFSRRITPAGSSEYKVDRKTVGREKYTQLLADIGVLVQAKNFLVF